MEKDETSVQLDVQVDTSELQKATEMAEKLNQLLGEANSLINELASREVKVITSIKDIGGFDSKHTLKNLVTSEECQSSFLAKSKVNSERLVNIISTLQDE